MSQPETILLDEPSMGLAPQLVEEIFGIVKGLNENEGVASCWPSRTPTWRCGSRITAISWKAAGW